MENKKVTTNSILEIFTEIKDVASKFPDDKSDEKIKAIKKLVTVGELLILMVNEKDEQVSGLISEKNIMARLMANGLLEARNIISEKDKEIQKLKDAIESLGRLMNVAVIHW